MNIYYVVIDCYEGMGKVIAACPTLKEAKQAAKQFREDTGGECNVHISKCRKEVVNGKATYYAIG